MPVPFNKWSLRIATVVVGAIILTLGIAHIVYPEQNSLLTTLQAIVGASHIVYMGVYVGYDWRLEYRK